MFQRKIYFYHLNALQKDFFCVCVCAFVSFVWFVWRVLLYFEVIYLFDSIDISPKSCIEIIYIPSLFTSLELKVYHEI